MHESQGSFKISLEQWAKNLRNEIQMVFAEIEISIFGMLEISKSEATGLVPRQIANPRPMLASILQRAS